MKFASARIGARIDFRLHTPRGRLTAQFKEQAESNPKLSGRVEMSKFATERIRRGGPAPRTNQ